jgi:signal transduction histidine kinase
MDPLEPRDDVAEPDAETLERAYQAENNEQFCHWFEFGIVLFFVFGIGFGVWVQLSRQAEDSDRLLVLAVASFAACLCGLLISRRPRFRPWMPWIACGGAMGIILLTGAVVQPTGIESAALHLLCLTTGTAVLLPWSWTFQLALCSASFGVLLYCAGGGPGIDAASNVLILALALLSHTMSVVGARLLEDKRRASFHRNALLAHTSALKDRLITDLRDTYRVKAEFVSTVSHELRTPLNVITGYATMLGDPQFGPLGDEQVKFLDRILQSARDQLELITATLEINRLDAGADTLDVGPVDLDALFAEVADDVRVTTETLVHLQFDNTLGARPIRTDRTKLKTIVRNLVNNALKFTPQGAVEVRAQEQGRHLTVTVRDTGIGIAEADVPSIFEMFRQVDGSDSRRFGGVGLGLHIVKRLVERLGGTITVASKPGVGSTFTVVLPPQS